MKTLLGSTLLGFALIACGNASDGENSDSAGSGGADSSSGGSGPISSGGGVATGGATGGQTASGGGPVVDPIPKVKVVMYLPNWNGSYADWATEIDFTKMTHLNLAFGTMDGDSNEWTLGANDDDVKALVAAAHAANVKVLVSIGGDSDDDGICNRYHDAANVGPMVANLSALVDRLGLDGVDVDVEIGAEMRADGNFPSFVSQLEDTLRAKGQLMTAALAQYILNDVGDIGGNGDDTTSTWLNSYDFINLMIYSNDMGTYTDQLDWWSNARGIPVEKLTWGVEFDNIDANFAKQVTTASKDYGGIMVWEYSMQDTDVLWPAIQQTL